MKATLHIFVVVLLGCGGSAGATVDSPARQNPKGTQPEVELAEPDDSHEGHGLECTMAGRVCPSADLPRFETELDPAGWARLRELAERGVVAVELGERVELMENCTLPGRYHEAVASSSSPGRAWAADRLVYTPDEPRGCGRATHFVAAFAIRGAAEGVAIALPLPCPTIGQGPPEGCVGAGLDDSAREQVARERWELAEQRVAGEGGRERALPLVLEVAALLPNARTYASVARLLEFLLAERYGGCLWLSEAAFAARVLDPSFRSVLDHTGSMDRLTPQHEPLHCLFRPSLLTCFPEHFVPGVGDNCW